MSEDRPISPIRLHKDLERAWGTGPGWRRLSAVNHTVIGKRFMITALVFFAIGGLLAMLIRAQLATPHSAFVGPEIYDQLFSMHGTVMMFLFAIPMLEGLAMYLLPKMLGARDLAFPRLSAYGYWCYLFGGAIIIASMFFGVAPNSGWFMYTPLSSQPHTPGINADIWLLGVTFVEISAVSAAIEITVSILKQRAPGMSLDRMPLFAWYMLVTALMMAFGFPPLILGSVLLELERAFGLPFFDPTRGGDPLLWQHLFWLFGHPEVYIIFLPAAGALSTIIPVFARRRIVGYHAIIAAIVALGFLSFGLWVHHMFTVGIPHLALAFFSAASALVAIPTAVQVFAWLATMAHGRLRFDVPMLYVIGFFVIFVIGGLTGVMLAMVPFDQQAHDSYFVVAHLHYVLIGGFVFPMLAGAYYWLPHLTGRQSVHRISVPAFWLIFVGFHLTFFMMHLTGLMGMPRRVYTYPSNFGWDWLNLLSSVGGFFLTMGFALFAVDLVLHLRFGKRFRRNIWGASTLEWAIPTRPTSYAFASLPSVAERADGLDPDTLGPALAGGRGYLGFVRHGRMETLGVHMTTGRLEQVVILPKSTYLPLISAIFTAGVVLCLLFKLYIAAIVLALAMFVSFLFWSRAMGLTEDCGPIPVGRGESAPPDLETPKPPPYWAMVFGLASNGTFYASLLFGVLYLWLIAPGWPPPHIVAPDMWMALIVPILLATSIAYRAAVGINRKAGTPIALLWIGLGVDALAIVVISLALAGLPDPSAHAHPASVAAVLGYGWLQVAGGMLFGINALMKAYGGYVSARRGLPLRLAAMWHDYTTVTGIAGVGLIFVMPGLIGMLEGVR